MKDKKKYNVLYWGPNSKNVRELDVLPTFRREWEKDGFDKKSVKDYDTLLDWIKNVSFYYYGYKCEYEVVVGSWPFGSYRLRENVEHFLEENPKPNLKDIDINNKFINIILKEMQKIDVHQQIMMNIDVITSILFEEFLSKTDN